jgi:hypothetical protein
MYWYLLESRKNRFRKRAEWAVLQTCVSSTTASSYMHVLEYNDLKKQEVENDCVVLMDHYSPSSSVPSPSVPFVDKINIGRSLRQNNRLYYLRINRLGE